MSQGIHKGFEGKLDPLRPPTAEEMAREAETREPRTVAIGSIPEGAKDPLWSAAEFNGTWSFCCVPFFYATFESMNEGDDVIKIDVTFCFYLKAQNAYARMGNTNRFWSTFYDKAEDGGGRSNEVVEFTSPTSRKNVSSPGALAFAWKTSK